MIYQTNILIFVNIDLKSELLCCDYEGVTTILKKIQNWKLPNLPGNLGISQMRLRIWKILQIPGNLVNFPKACEFGKFCSHLGNFPNTWEQGKFPKCLVI